MYTCSAHGINGGILKLVIIAQPQLFEAELRVDAQGGERNFGGGSVQVVLHMHAALLLQAAYDGLVCAAQRRMEGHVRAKPVLPTFSAVAARGRDR